MSKGVEPVIEPVTHSCKKVSYKAPKAQFVPVVVNGKLAFKFDPRRGLIEWQHRGEKHVIDLADYADNDETISRSIAVSIPTEPHRS
jgi:hypothetical protein